MPADQIQNTKAFESDISYLKNRQRLLIDLIKSKHKDFYVWMVENGIDPTDLKAYFAGIAVALMVMFTTKLTPISSIRGISGNSQVIEVKVQAIQKEELIGKSEEEKGELVMRRYGHVIDKAASRYSLDPNLIFATVMVESGGNTYASRYEPHLNDSSYGLGQIMFSTARWIGFEGSREDLYDPEVNIDLIGRYYFKNKTMFGDDLTVEQLVTSYNAGNPFARPTAGHIQKFQKWFNKASSIRS
uniref:Transglycosylase SLT domain-containing protein n=1 Tax=candidate division WWE3 bacterium TaxID=2053526 RepID=A0A7C4XNK9_UNCKA